MKHQPVYPDPMRGAEQSIINQSPHQLNEGITIRELFAMAAMQGLLSNSNTAYQIRAAFGDVTPDGADKVLMEKAVDLADKLLKQLES